jgi:hypothetical protein
MTEKKTTMLLTVGEIRRAILGLSDSCTVVLEFQSGRDDGDDPGEKMTPVQAFRDMLTDNLVIVINDDDADV